MLLSMQSNSNVVCMVSFLFPRVESSFSPATKKFISMDVGCWIDKKRMRQKSSVSFPMMSSWQHPVLCLLVAAKETNAEITMFIGRSAMMMTQYKKQLTCFIFLVDVDIHGHFSTGWTKQKFMMWTSPWTNMPIFVQQVVQNTNFEGII